MFIPVLRFAKLNSTRSKGHGVANQLAALLLAFSCAGRMHREYHEQRASEYVYQRPLDGALEDAQRALQAQGFQVMRLGDHLLTQWRGNGSTATRLLVLAILVDDAHSRLQVYELSLRPREAREDVSVKNKADLLRGAEAKVDSWSSQSNTDMDPRPARRAWEQEWKLLQTLNAKAAREIEAEETVVNGCAVTKVFRSHREPAVFPQLPKGFCLADVEGVSQLIETHRLIILGEQHGTREAPLFAGNLACQAAAAGHAVSIAVELPRTDQTFLDRYLASEGSPHDKRDLLFSGSSWVHTYYDGRSSEAVFTLLERVRVMRRAGMPISLFAYDDPDRVGAERDASMAQAVEALRRQRLDEMTIVLTGNVHARTVQGVPWDSTFLPMGAYLERFGLRPVTLNMSFVSGDAWNCADEKKLDCGVHSIRSTKVPLAHSWRVARNPRDPNTPAGELMPVSTRGFYVETWDSPSPEGYSGEFYVGTLTASPPAYDPGLAL